MWDGREGMWKSWEVKNTTSEVKMRLFPSWPSLVTFPLKGIHHTQFPSKRNYKLLELTMYRWAPSWIFVPSSSQSFLAMMSTSSPGHLPRFDVTSYKGLSPVFQPCGQKKRKKNCKVDKKIPIKILFHNPPSHTFVKLLFHDSQGFPAKIFPSALSLVTGTDEPQKGERKAKEAGKEFALCACPSFES